MSAPRDPLVSVIVPTYNGASYLRAALDSILAQTFRDFEVIVIDDVSSDDTVGISAEYAGRDARIRLYRNEKNLGFAGNRNKATGLARGRYIAWQDQDDISLPRRLEQQLALIDSDERIAMVGGAMEVFDDESGASRVRRYPTDDADIRRMIFRFSPIALPACMMRKSALVEVGGYSERWSPAGDLDMTFKIGLQHRLANVADVVIRYRSHTNSATARHLKRIERDSVRIRFGYNGSPGYRMSAGDYLYNLAHWISIWVVPPALKIRLFKHIRDSAT